MSDIKLAFEFFAVLRENFPQGIELGFSSPPKREQIIAALTAYIGRDIPLLERCQFAFENEVVNPQYAFTRSGLVFVFPPFSGG